MGLLSTPPSAHDPKRQPTAYISLNRHLYWVIGSKPGTMLLEVENCLTGFRSHLSVHEVMASKLEKAAPTLVVPDTIPEMAA